MITLLKKFLIHLLSNIIRYLIILLTNQLLKKMKKYFKLKKIKYDFLKQYQQYH